jgi:hypothetical protein
MQITQVIAFLAVAIVGAIAVPGGHPPPPPPPPPSRPTSVVQQVYWLWLPPTLLRSSDSRFRFPAVATLARTAALQVNPMEPPALVLLDHLSTAMASLSAATTMQV